MILKNSFILDIQFNNGGYKYILEYHLVKIETCNGYIYIYIYMYNKTEY
jgi:hypothetical protein